MENVRDGECQRGVMSARGNVREGQCQERAIARKVRRRSRLSTACGVTAYVGHPCVTAWAMRERLDFVEFGRREGRHVASDALLCVKGARALEKYCEGVVSEFERRS